MFSNVTIAALAVGAALAILIPVAAVIVYKVKNRDTWLSSAFIGAGTFIVFALVLEQLLHTVMLPIVQGNPWIYAVYGALAAGVFEETGRFVAYKTLMRKHYTTKNAVLMGLGHGGVEAALVLGVMLLTYLTLTLSANSVGLDKALETAAKGNAEIAQTLGAQLESIREYNFISCALGIYERVIAMTLHTCLSVWVYKAVTHKVWLYPAAIAAHAAFDIFAALFQAGVITSILLLYIIFTVFVVVTVFVTVKLTKKYPDNAR